MRKAVGRFHLIHSIDSLKFLEKISSVSGEMQCTTSVLLQVNVSHEESKHGFSEEEIESLFSKMIQLPKISICGLMTMAPSFEKVQSKELLCQAFRRLAALKERLEIAHRTRLPELSMGMSQDYRLAVREGATMVRIGTSIFCK